MSHRSIIIGDVHGCASELSVLLEHLQLEPIDDVIFVGDLVNKGPDSHGVLDLVRQVRGRCILGNHEYRLLRYRQSGDPGILKSDDRTTLRSLTEPDWIFLEKLPLTIELPEYNAVVAHGGFLPHVPWRQQGPEVVTKIQVVDEAGRAAKRSDAPKGQLWADLWKGPEYVIYGHTPRRTTVRRPHSIGLDTGCVYGGRLTALILPENKLCQIRARKAYSKKAL